MSRLLPTRLSGRLAALYVLVVVLLGIGWLGATRAMGTMHAQFQDVVQHDDRLGDLVTTMTKGMLDQETGWRGFVLTGAPRFLEPYQAGRRALSGATAQADSLTLNETAATRALLATTEHRAAAWQEWAAAGVRAGLQGHHARQAGGRLEGRGKHLFDAFRVATDHLAAYLKQDRQGALAASEATFTGATRLFGLLTLGTLLLTSLLGWRLARSLVVPIRHLEQAARQIQQGHLDRAVPHQGADELAHLGTAMETMRVQLHLRNALALLLSSTLDLSRIFPDCAALLQQVAPFARLSLARVDDTGTLVQAFATGLPLEGLPVGAPLPPTGTATGEAYRTRRPVVYQDIVALPSAAWNPLTDALVALGLRAVIAVPLVSQGEVAGVLALMSAEPGAYDDATVTTLDSVAPLLASALVNARLYQQVIGANVQLDQANQAKSAFLANMSHELRTPLNAIIGFSEVLVDETFGPLVPRQARYVGNILESGRHLLGLINDVLDLSKVEAGRMDLHREDVALGEILAQSHEQMAPLALQKEVALVVVPPAHTVRVWADHVRLRQILYNLLSNALKFTPAGGRVTLRGRRRDRTVEIAVQDTGIGIAPADQEHVFEEFGQVDSTLSRTQQGTGLGLALSRRLVEAHGGTLTLESAAGTGSTFTVALPDAPAALVTEDGGDRDAGGSATGAGEKTSGGEERSGMVLVVDDDETACELLRVYLEGAGYRTECVERVEEVLPRARALQPVAIVLDLMLHGEVAWSVLEHLATDPLTRAIPVVITSALDEEARGQALGASAYLTKPIARPTFLATLARIAGVPVPGRALRVLAVDDDPLALDLIALALHGAGAAYEVARATSGVEALALLAGEPPDVLLVDLVMAPLDGFALIDAVAADARLHRMPIIVLSAQTLTRAERLRLEQRTVAILPKTGAGGERLLRELARVTGRETLS